MTKYVTAKELKKAADYLVDIKEEGGCYHWKIANKDNKNICIVLGWINNFDEDDPDKDKYQDGPWRLAVKVGYQPDNSVMQSDYDVDFNLPYNPETGVGYDDCEYCIYETTDFDELAKDINYMASYVIEHWKELGHE